MNLKTLIGAYINLSNALNGLMSFLEFNLKNNILIAKKSNSDG